MIDVGLAGAGWLDLGASVILVGGLAYGTLVGEPSVAGRGAMRAAVPVLALALALEFVLTVLRVRAVSDLGTGPVVLDLLYVRWGKLWILRGVGLILVAPRTRVAVLLAAPWLFLRSFQGHAGAHGIVPALIDWLHLVAAAIWIGGLVQLGLLPRPMPSLVARRMRAVATATLAVVLPAGVYGAVLHVQRWDMLLGSPYGRALLVKVTIASTLVALGAVNHFRHVPALVQGDAEAAGRLTTTVRFELLLAAAVLLVTAILGELAMPHVHPG